MIRFAGFFIGSDVDQKKKNAKIKIEKVHPWEILLDPVDAAYGTPRSMIRIKYIPKEVLIAKYPKYRKAIEEAQQATTEVDTLLSYSAGVRDRDESEMILTMET